MHGKVSRLRDGIMFCNQSIQTCILGIWKLQCFGGFAKCSNYLPTGTAKGFHLNLLIQCYPFSKILSSLSARVHCSIISKQCKILLCHYLKVYSVILAPWGWCTGACCVTLRHFGYQLFPGLLTQCLHGPWYKVQEAFLSGWISGNMWQSRYFRSRHPGSLDACSHWRSVWNPIEATIQIHHKTHGPFIQWTQWRWCHKKPISYLCHCWQPFVLFHLPDATANGGSKRHFVPFCFDTKCCGVPHMSAYSCPTSG